MRQSARAYQKLLLALIITLAATSTAYAGAEVEPMGRASVVIEQSTRRVLWGYNAHERLPMASITKVMTCMLALQRGNLDDIVTISANASGVEGSSLYLKAGEEVVLEDLLYGLMLRSGNDAAVAIAEHIAGSVEAFVGMMNDMAYELGAYNTHFVNPHGLHDAQHYTTAYDWAIITAEAYETRGFSEITSTQSFRIRATNLSYARTVKNKNQLLETYQGCDGVKIGFTQKSGRCLVSSAQRDGMRLICVVLDCYDMFGHSAQLMDECFNTYRMYCPIGNGDVVTQLEVRASRPSMINTITQGIRVPLTQDEIALCRMVVIPKEDVRAPLVVGDRVGKVVVYLGAEEIAQTELIAAQGAQVNTWAAWMRRIMDEYICKGSSPSGYKNTSQAVG